jgi:hypothetical protein
MQLLGERSGRIESTTFRPRMVNGKVFYEAPVAVRHYLQ